VPDAVLDLRYATADNIAGVALYPVARCWMRRRRRSWRAPPRAARAGFRLLLWTAIGRRRCSRRCGIVSTIHVRRAAGVRRPGRLARGSAHSRAWRSTSPRRAKRGGPAAHRDDFSGRRAAIARAAGDNLGAARGDGRGGFTPLASEWWHYERARRGANR
jgi:D-alanyl-D-alanine dipeptidase